VLTHLPNRALLNEFLTEAIALGRRSAAPRFTARQGSGRRATTWTTA
jgi:GGDEF domain-containing protein